MQLYNLYILIHIIWVLKMVKFCIKDRAKNRTFCFGMEGISITDEFLILASGFMEPEYLKRSKNYYLEVTKSLISMNKYWSVPHIYFKL
jgi:hypothetical protein